MFAESESALRDDWTPHNPTDPFVERSWTFIQYQGSKIARFQNLLSAGHSTTNPPRLLMKHFAYEMSRGEYNVVGYGKEISRK